MGKYTKSGEISPHMSATTLLVSVEDLINMAMGPDDKNVVNFKLLQTVLHILARQMRLLEQRVEIKVTEYITQKEKEAQEEKEHPRPRPVSKDRTKQQTAAKAEKEAAREKEKQTRSAEKERRNIERSLQKEKEREERTAAKEKAREDRSISRDRDKAEKAAAKDREREERATSKEREKAEKAAAKDREREDRAASRDREKAEKGAAKDREREDRAASKDKDKAERAAAKDRERDERATSKDRERAERAAAKDREKEDRAASRDREKADRAAAKEREKEEKTASKDKDKAERAAEKDKQRTDKAASKDREREEKASAKEREKEEKAAAKADKAASKDREKEERAASKERERAEKAQAKEAKEMEKEERARSKEREKEDKAAAKDERAASKEREKEAAKAEKRDLKDKGRAEKDQEKAELAQEKAREKSEKEVREPEKVAKTAKGKKGKADTSIAVKEEERDKEKVLVVEKGPTTRSASGGTRSNIEVVTRSQFDLLKDVVTDLKQKAGPLPMPSMPQNKELLQRLSKGTASLTDMMGAMQVNARVVAAEQAISRMGGILTQLATAGALPEDIAGEVGKVTEELEAELQEMDARDEAQAEAAGTVQITAAPRPSRSRASTAASRKSVLSTKSRVSTVGTGGRASTAPSMATAGSGVSAPYIPPKVTHPELDDAVRMLKEDLSKNMAFMTAKSSAAADTALSMVKSVAEKLETAVKLDLRISTLHSMVSDYAEQLSGFDAGLSTQMQSFSEQMVQMRGDLQSGLKLLELVNNNAETAAVMELTERYEGLVTELDHTLQSHSELTITQEHLGEDLRGLIEAVEMLREQKADRDEVQDGLRDKADNSRLAGLLTEQEFATSRAELERRLAVCHDKFYRQDGVWMKAVRDLKEITDVKADLVHLLGTREEVQMGLEMLHDMCRNLALVLGEPKAAVLTRKLTRGALCAACMAPALMEPRDANAGAPPPLPAARPRPAGAPAADDTCEFKLPAPPDTREHTCNRWVGGSHTLMSDAVSRLHAQPMTYPSVPTNRFTGYGEDGRLYMMEEELQPCLECNKLSDEAEGIQDVNLNIAI